MITLDLDQGSPEWFEARLGLITASNFDKLITSTGKRSTQSKSYMHKLLAEWLTGTSISQEANEWMQRGNELEAEARSFYELMTGFDVKQVGLVYADEDKTVSCSPDGLMSDRGLEIKCPAPHTHVSYLLSGKLPSKYVAQVQGSMYVTGLNKWDFLSFHPEMEPLLITVERDVKFCASLHQTICDLVIEMDAAKLKLKPQEKAA